MERNIKELINNIDINKRARFRRTLQHIITSYPNLADQVIENFESFDHDKVSNEIFSISAGQTIKNPPETLKGLLTLKQGRVNPGGSLGEGEIFLKFALEGIMLGQGFEGKYDIELENGDKYHVKKGEALIGKWLDGLDKVKSKFPELEHFIGNQDDAGMVELRELLITNGLQDIVSGKTEDKQWQKLANYSYKELANHMAKAFHAAFIMGSNLMENGVKGSYFIEEEGIIFKPTNQIYSSGTMVDGRFRTDIDYTLEGMGIYQACLFLDEEEIKRNLKEILVKITNQIDNNEIESFEQLMEVYVENDLGPNMPYRMFANPPVEKVLLASLIWKLGDINKPLYKNLGTYFLKHDIMNCAKKGYLRKRDNAESNVMGTLSTNEEAIKEIPGQFLFYFYKIFHDLNESGSTTIEGKNVLSNDLLETIIMPKRKNILEIKKRVRLFETVKDSSLYKTFVVPFTNAFDVAKVAFKDVFNALIYNTQVLLTINPDELERVKSEYKSKLNNIMSEYKELDDRLREAGGPDQDAFMFMMNPGLYFMQSISQKIPPTVRDITSWLQDQKFSPGLISLTSLDKAAFAAGAAYSADL